MRDAGCVAVVALGGDGTSRAIARAWCDVPLVALSTGTNNVFPTLVEAGLAGAAAGLVASGALPTGDVARASKVVRVAVEGEPEDLALVDATFLADDHVGNLLPFDPARLRRVVLARAEPAAVGASPIGGLLLPAGADDDFGVAVECAPPGEPGRTLRVPLSPGLWRVVRVGSFRKLELGESVQICGPGVLALDGDRERDLAAGQQADLCLRRTGPRVIDVRRALALAAARGLFVDGRE
jgi:hypothetical protein